MFDMDALIKEKKGSFALGLDLMLWIARIFFVIAIAMLVAFVVNSHNTRDINIKTIEGDVILNRLFYSPGCFAYNDVKTHVGVIDIEKFRDENIKKCLDGDYYIRAELAGLKKTAYNDKVAYDAYAGFCKFENKIYCYGKEIYVVVNDNGIMKNDLLKLNLIGKQFDGALLR